MRIILLIYFINSFIFSSKHNKSASYESKRTNAEKHSEMLNNTTWKHSRKRITHKVANIRLCGKGPRQDKNKDEEIQDNMQELRFSQYGQYIQEKLGLF